jgi:hypothetical protein
MFNISPATLLRQTAGECANNRSMAHHPRIAADAIIVISVSFPVSFRLWRLAHFMHADAVEAYVLMGVIAVQLGHSDTRITERAPVAGVCGRNSPRCAVGAWGCRADECRDLEDFAPRLRRSKARRDAPPKASFFNDEVPSLNGPVEESAPTTTVFSSLLPPAMSMSASLFVVPRRGRKPESSHQRRCSTV